MGAPAAVRPSYNETFELIDVAWLNGNLIELAFGVGVFCQLELTRRVV